MTFDGSVRIPLNRLLGAIRPNWTVEEINAATMKLATLPGAATDLCIRALARAGCATNERAVTILADHDMAPRHRDILDQEMQVCEAHGGAIKRRDGRWHCCVVEDVWPDDETRQVTPRALPLTAAEIIAGLDALRGTQHQKLEAQNEAKSG